MKYSFRQVRFHETEVIELSSNETISDIRVIDIQRKRKHPFYGKRIYVGRIATVTG